MQINIKPIFTRKDLYLNSDPSHTPFWGNKNKIYILVKGPRTFNRSFHAPTGIYPFSYSSSLAHQVSFQCAEDGPLIGSTLVTWTLTFSCSLGFVCGDAMFCLDVKLWHVLCGSKRLLHLRTIHIWHSYGFKHGNLSWRSLLCWFSGPYPGR